MSDYGMSYGSSTPGSPPQDVVPGEQYRYALTNFRIAHDQVEKQRQQLQEQERQVALLNARIAALEGGEDERKVAANGLNNGTVDDYSIKNAASKLERLINRWAADICRIQAIPLDDLRSAALWDIHDGIGVPKPAAPPTAIHVQSLLRHAMSDAICEGVVNCLIVTDSTETNIQLSRIHEHIFARDPIVAGAWRRQTFTAAIDKPSAAMTTGILSEHLPALYGLLGASSGPALADLINAAYDFSRMLHGAGSSAGDAFYRAFVPELRAPLDARQVELVKRCARCEAGEPEQVGATVFLGLVKVASMQQLRGKAANTQSVMRRAMVICECALLGSGP